MSLIGRVLGELRDGRKGFRLSWSSNHTLCYFLGLPVFAKNNLNLKQLN
jgi:hypothetical protein